MCACTHVCMHACAHARGTDSLREPSASSAKSSLNSASPIDDRRDLIPAVCVHACARVRLGIASLPKLVHTEARFNRPCRGRCCRTQRPPKLPSSSSSSPSSLPSLSSHCQQQQRQHTVRDRQSARRTLLLQLGIPAGELLLQPFELLLEPCTDMCVDMCADMCTDMCVDVCVWT